MATAKKMGAVDSTTGNLRSALRDAQLVILDTPLSEVRELMEAIGPILEEGSVVTDTCISKSRVMEWADQYLPDSVSFVASNPVPKRQILTLEEADPSIFEGIDYCVMPAKSANQAAVRMVVGLVERLGATPLFLDVAEHDSYTAAMTVLPMVLSSAFTGVTSRSDGWRDMHRLATSEFDDFSSLASVDPYDTQIACLSNPDALVRWLDQMIAELHSYRDQINESSDELLETFITAWEARAKWEVGAVVQERQPDLPTTSQTMARPFLGERLAKRYIGSGERSISESAWRYPRKT